MQQLIASNNTTKAIAHYNELAYNIQRKPATIITYCQALFIENQEEKAISCLVEEFSNSPSLDILKTIYLICTKETTEAIIKSLEKNIQKNPGNYMYLVGKAMILIKNQKLKEASTLLTKANSQNPSPEIKMLISYCQKETKEEKDKK